MIFLFHLVPRYPSRTPKRWPLGVVLLVWLLPGTGCGPWGPGSSKPGTLRVVAAIEPVAYLVERIAGPWAQVHVLIPSGADPHTFQLSPREVAELAQADLFFKVGLALEERILEKVRQGRPDFPVVDLARGIDRRRSFHEHQANHSDAHEKASPEHKEAVEDDQAPGTQDHDDASCESAGWDPHIWLSPPLLKTAARQIGEALSKADPVHASEYQQNLAQLEAELDALHAWISQQLAPFRGRCFFVFHPSFGYFADTYRLRQVAVQVEGKSPTPQDLRRLIELAQAEQAQVLLVQPQFHAHSAQIVAEAIGARMVVVNDLERNVLEGLRTLTATLVEAFQSAEKSTKKRET